MTIDMKKAIAWYQANVGKHTYSQNPPRFDCSSSVANALIAAGAQKVNPLDYTTVNLGAYLKASGFKLVYSGKTAGATNTQYGDVILMSIGDTMGASGGMGGHTGVIGNSGIFWNTTATRWTDGVTFVKGQAVQQAPWLEYIKITRLKAHTEIWRLPGAKPSGKLDVDGLLGLKTWQAMEKAAGVAPDNVMSGQTTNNKGRLHAVTVAVKYTGEGSLTIAKWQKWLGVSPDGIIGHDFITALQSELKNLGYYNGMIDGVLDAPSATVRGLQELLNSGFKL